MGVAQAAVERYLALGRKASTNVEQKQCTRVPLRDCGFDLSLGYTLTEHYIQEDGIPWTNVMARYKMPSITHTPVIESHIVEHGVAAGPYGAKGVGELPSIPTSAAITNAIYRATGVRVRSLPVDQDELLRAIQSGAGEVEIAWGDRGPIPDVALGGGQ